MSRSKGIFRIALSILFIYVGLALKHTYDFAFWRVVCTIILVYGGAIALPPAIAAVMAMDSWNAFYENRCISAQLVRQELDAELNNEFKYGNIIGIFLTVILVCEGGGLYISSGNPAFLMGNMITIAAIWALRCLAIKRKKHKNERIRIVRDTIINIDDAITPKYYWKLLNRGRGIDRNTVIYVSFGDTDVHGLEKGTDLYLAIDQSGVARRFFNAAEFEFADE